MTCVAALKRDGVVYICADSAATSTTFAYNIRSDRKVHVTDRYVMGYSTSYRAGQLMQHVFDAPDHPHDESDMTYMVKHFMESVRTVLKDGGYIKTTDGVESMDFDMIVGYNGELYTFCSDMQVAVVSEDYVAIGAGGDYALGAMAYMKKHCDWSTMKPRTILQRAVEAAVAHDSSVRPPYVHVSKKFKVRS